MRGAAILICALTACASAPAPTKTGTPAPAPSRPTSAPQQQPPPAPEALTPAERAARIVEAQRATDGSSLTNAFIDVRSDLESGDEPRVTAALRVIEEMAGLTARMRYTTDRSDVRVYRDHLDPLLKDADELVARMVYDVSCANQHAAAPAAAALAGVPRARFGFAGEQDRLTGPLSKHALVCGMTAIRDKVHDCFTLHQVPGVVMMNVVIGKRGLVTAATASGKFAGTPSGACVEAAVKTVVFPPSDGFSTPYPYLLK